MTQSQLFERFEAAATRNPEKVALVCAGHRHAYKSMLEDARGLAAGLTALGVRPGEHIGVLLPNCYEFVLLLLASARIGAVLVPQSMGMGMEAINSTFRASDVRHIVSWHGAIVSSVGESAARFGSVLGLQISVGDVRYGWTEFRDLIDRGRLDCEPASLVENQPYFMVLTSGSTGAPKPIVLGQLTKLKRAMSAVELYRITEADVTLAATPLYHSLAQRLVLIPLLTGGTSVLLEHFTPAAWIRSVRESGVTFSIAVSSQLKQLLPALQESKEPLGSLRCLVSSSALLDDVTKAALFKVLRCEFHECYGASEIAIATNLSPAGASRRMGSVGVAVPGAEVRIIDERGTEVARGASGEIVCRTPMLFSGYFALPEVTRGALWGEYFRTGDLGKIDEEGFLYFLGRIKDIIITGGINVYPKDVEDVVAMHAEVRESVAIPVEDDRLGEAVGVVVAFKNPSAPPELREIQLLCVAHLADYQQPRRYHVVPELPKNPMGKIDKPALRRQFSGPEAAKLT